MAAAFEAARAGDVVTVERLLDRAPDGVDARGEHGTVLLHVAAERNDVPMVGLLLDRGADPEARAVWGQTPFEWAANMNAGEAARALLERGAGRLDLWTAAALGMAEEVSGFLGEAGSGPVSSGRRPREGANLDGWTNDSAFLRGDHVSDAFYIACRNGRMEVARMLLACGADVDARGYFGATTVSWTAAGGHDDLVEWLLAAGADPSLRDPRFGGDAASWAREFGHDALADRIDDLTSAARSGSPA